MNDEAKRAARLRATIAFVVAGVLLVADVAVVAATRDHREDRGRIVWDRELPGPRGDRDTPFDRDDGELGPLGPGEGQGPIGGRPPGQNGTGDRDRSGDQQGSGNRNEPGGADGSATTTSTTVAGGA